MKMLLPNGFLIICQTFSLGEFQSQTVKFEVNEVIPHQEAPFHGAKPIGRSLEQLSAKKN
jgi:hypothetical protein